MNDSRDTLFAQPLATAEPFRFDAGVARVFPDMIERSVPGYSSIIAMTGVLAGKYAAEGSRLYDLGCSLGASTLAMRQHLHGRDCRIVAVDNSAAMLERCRSVIASHPQDTPVELICANLQDVPIDDASVVVLNFTLQFVPPALRDAVVDAIYRGLRPGGMLLLSEKIRFPDPSREALNIELHEQFKRANGYSELEVAQKRNALETVLRPETLETHRQRARRAGFKRCEAWFQCFNFASLIALK